MSVFFYNSLFIKLILFLTFLERNSSAVVLTASLKLNLTKSMEYPGTAELEMCFLSY